MSNLLEELKGSVEEPTVEIFRVGPEDTEEFLSKLLVTMGAKLDDIRHIKVTHERKKLRLIATVSKDSDIFRQKGRSSAGTPHLAILGSAEVEDGIKLSDLAKSALKQVGFYYRKTDEEYAKDVWLVSMSELKRTVEIEFDPEVAMAIITDTDYTDVHFVVDAVEEVIESKKHRRKKFKGKKKTVTFATVSRKFHNDNGFSAEQVGQYENDEYEEDDEDEDDE